MPDKEIKVPNIGEFKDVEVIEVLVLNGQSFSKNDPRYNHNQVYKSKVRHKA